jgi:hypothetical protein
VTGKAGVHVTGTAGNLNGRGLRLFVLRPTGDYHLVDQAPIPVPDGRWAYYIAPFGQGEQDVGKTLVLTAVIAQGGCGDSLRADWQSSHGNVLYTRLPAGCREVAHVRVTKTAP